MRIDVNLTEGSQLFDVTLAEGGSGNIKWGEITGTLNRQSDLQTALDSKAAAIQQKSGTVPSGAGFEDFAAAIGTISSGSTRVTITMDTTLSTNILNQIGAVFERLYASAKISGTYVYAVNTVSRRSSKHTMMVSFCDGACKTIARCMNTSNSLNAINVTSTNQDFEIYEGDVYEIYILQLA